MKIRSLFAASILSGVVLVSTNSLHAEPMVLTEDVIQRYTAIFPQYWRILMELDSTSKMKDGEAKDTKVNGLIERRNQLLTSNGWEDFSEFQEADGRIVRAIVPLNMIQKFKDHPEPDRQKVEETVTEQLKDYSAEEIALLKKNLVRITKMREKALAGAK
ncbi:MAG: hypothetical protein JNM27_02190 [Leptospirales bacterium]|nr:hypothetical protein [Leptospirales bacterium]